jgi:outer membrane protein assembly factor BamE (lipoprotein component of BamABCDE complex)
MKRDYYSVMGVRPSATTEEIRKAYRKKSRECHPDMGGTEEAMKELNAAWNCLRDLESRAPYDRDRQTRDRSAKPGSEESPRSSSSASTHSEPSQASASAPDGHSRPWWSWVEPSWLATLAAVVFLCLSIVAASSTNRGAKNTSRAGGSTVGNLARSTTWSTPSHEPSDGSSPAPSKDIPSATPTQPFPKDTPTGTTTPPSTSPSTQPKTYSSSFTMGSTQEEVREVMGTPTTVHKYAALDKEDWAYGDSAVTFSNAGVVKEWNNRGNLKVQLSSTTTASLFTMGSTKDVVMAAMGTPTGVHKYPSLDKEDWAYGDSAVTFSNAGIVKEWTNRGNLMVQLSTTAIASSFTMGSTKDVVMAAMGTPTGVHKYPSLDKEDWAYGNSAVTFSNAGVVKEWNNRGNLKVR